MYALWCVPLVGRQTQNLKVDPMKVELPDAQGRTKRSRKKHSRENALDVVVKSSSRSPRERLEVLRVRLCPILLVKRWVGECTHVKVYSVLRWCVK